MSEKGSSICQSLIIAITVAVVSSVINYFIWKNQWQAQLSEKSFESRYELIKDTASLCTKYQSLRRDAIGYNIMFRSMTQDVPKTNVEKMSEIEKRLQLLRPHDYSASLETERMFPQVQSQLVLVQLFFGEKTVNAILPYQTVMATTPDDYINRYLKQGFQKSNTIRRTRAGVYLAPEMGRLLGTVEKEQNVALLNVLNAMKEEMGVRASNP